MNLLPFLETIKTPYVSIDDFCRRHGLVKSEVIQELQRYDFQDLQDWRDLYSVKTKYYDKNGNEYEDEMSARMKLVRSKRNKEEIDIEERVVGIKHWRYQDISTIINIFICEKLFNVPVSYGTFTDYQEHSDYSRGYHISEKHYQAFNFSQRLPAFTDDTQLISMMINKLGEVFIEPTSEGYTVRSNGFKVRGSTLNLALAKLCYKVAKNISPKFRRS